MTDRIEVRGLRLLGRHGSNPGEQEQPQPFELDLDVEADLEAAAASDDLSATLDYGRFVEAARRIVETERFSLLEALAAAICEALLEDPRAQLVTVALRKLRPPLAADVASVGVRLTRGRAVDDHH